MKKLIVAAICAMFALSSAYAQDKAEAMKAAPAAVNKAEAKDGKKTAEKAEQKVEKAKKAPTEAQKKQQDRMRQCSTDAKAKGIKSKEERNKFMSACLKG